MAMFEYKESQYQEGDEGPPFSKEIMAMPLPSSFKERIDMEAYDEPTNSQDHLNTFQSCMYLLGTTDAIKCMAFPITLRKSALKSFNTSLPGQ